MKIKVYIVTYKKNDVLNKNLESLWQNTKNTKEIYVTVLSNHPDIKIYKENRRRNLRIVINTTRMPFAWGNLAKDWNYCILDCFKNISNPYNIKWCTLAQNDVIWVKNWDEYLLNNDKYDLITQAFGDQSISLNINAIQKIGFFDERFTTLHFHEIDFFIRSIINLGERVSINDHEAHNFTYNPVGEVITKISASGFAEDQTMHNSINWKESYDFICQKYNVDILKKDINWLIDSRDRLRLKKIKEINWYPFFWHEFKNEEKSLKSFLVLHWRKCRATQRIERWRKETWPAIKKTLNKSRSGK